jgi:hypothetical protein
MKYRFLLVFATCCFAISASAQSPLYKKMEQTSDVKTKLAFVTTTQIDTKGRIVHYREMANSGKKNIDLFNPDLTLKGVIEVPKLKFQKEDADFQSVILLADKFFYIYSVTSAKDIFYLFAREIDFDALKLSEREILIHKEPFFREKSVYNHGIAAMKYDFWGIKTKFAIGTTNENQHLLLIRHDAVYEPDVFQFAIASFDKDFKLEWKEEKSLESGMWPYILNDGIFVLSSEKQISAFTHKKLPSKKLQFGTGDAYAPDSCYTILSKNHDTKKNIKQDLVFKGYEISCHSYVIDTLNNHIIFAGLAFPANKKNEIYTVLVKLDVNDLKIVSQEISKLDNELLLQYLPENEAQRERSLQNVTLSTALFGWRFVCAGVNPINSEISASFEKSYYNVPPVITAFSSTEYYFGDILSLRFNSDGTLKAKKLIPKRQIDASNLGLSCVGKNINGSDIYFFNDSQENSELKPGDVPKTVKGRTKKEPFIVKIDKEGRVEKRALLPSNENKFQFSPFSVRFFESQCIVKLDGEGFYRLVKLGF